MVQFSLGLAPVDGLVDVLGRCSVGPGLVFDWLLIGVSCVSGVRRVSLSVKFVVVPGAGGAGGGGVEGVGDVDGGGGGEGGVTDDGRKVD